jgi:hypothetical protein
VFPIDINMQQVRESGDPLVFQYALKEFLLNIFFIMFPLIFYQFTIDEKLKDKIALKTVVTFLFGIPMILCMIFPIVDQNQFIFDLRLIPLILACLYSCFTFNNGYRQKISLPVYV